MFPRSQSLQNNTDKKYQKKTQESGENTYYLKENYQKKSETGKKITRIHKKYNEKFQGRK